MTSRIGNVVYTIHVDGMGCDYNNMCDLICSLSLDVLVQERAKRIVVFVFFGKWYSCAFGLCSF